VADYSHILGIETAIGGGSLALFHDDLELASLEGGAGISRAEDLLPNISRLLDGCHIEAAELTSIVVSTGPGSFTGIRVGIATALGLRSACSISCVGISALEAMAFTSEILRVIAAVPMGRDLVCLQSFTNLAPDCDPQLVPLDRLSLELLRIDAPSVVCHADIHENVLAIAPQNAQVHNIGRKLASLLCLSARSRFAREQIKPFFVDRRAFIKI